MSNVVLIRRHPDFLSQARVQLRVVGAIILRELHTRFGRNNAGYPFYLSGYITYIVFRDNVNRASGLIEANRPLLLHKNVTLLDMTIVRVALDAIATTGAMAMILSAFVISGLSPMPERPWLVLAGLALMSWLSLGISAVVSGASDSRPWWSVRASCDVPASAVLRHVLGHG